MFFFNDFVIFTFSFCKPTSLHVIYGGNQSILICAITRRLIDFCQFEEICPFSLHLTEYYYCLKLSALRKLEWGVDVL